MARRSESERGSGSDGWRLPPVASSYTHVTFPYLRIARPRGLTVAPHAPAEAAESISRSAERFVDWLFTRAGLDHRSYRRETLRRRLPACLRALRAPTPALARRMIEDRPELLRDALSSMLVGVTTFFRDRAVFHALDEEIRSVLPRNPHRQGVYVWSIGCSTGAELYSVALLLAQHPGLLQRSYLVGTDCRADAIDVARRGWYSPDEVEGLSPEWLERGFHPERQGWQVQPFVRGSIHWHVSDILRDREAGVWDLILFRNTSMYMQPESTDPLWERLEAALRPGGLLVLGRAERPTGQRRLAPVSSCIWRRTSRPRMQFETLR